MTLPTKVKTWQYDVNQATPAGYSDTLLALKDSLIGFASNPWTVWGSSDSVAWGNGDTVDRWGDAADVVSAAPGSPHSWIVLTNAAAGVHMCLDDVNGANNLAVVTSVLGFGASNGGADGDDSDRPTAADELIVANADVMYSWVNPSKMHAMMSSDGECTRVIACQGGTTVFMLFVDKPLNPSAEWTTTYQFCANAVSTYYQLNDTATVKAVIDGVSCTAHMTCEGFVDAAIGEQLTVADDDTGEWAMCPIGLYVPTATRRGRKGAVYDLWWGSTARGGGDAYPGDASCQFAQFGHLIFPWNGTVPQAA